MSPSGIRDSLEKIRSEMIALETELEVPIGKGVIGLIEVRHELVESSDGISRAIESLDVNYAAMS